ncbi:MAG: hypothetical protein CTR53_10325 [Ferrovibrio sp.]|nr:MAG: hypothetical protein CTR53_10325 [Ferrovibrio sp.]
MEIKQTQARFYMEQDLFERTLLRYALIALFKKATDNKLLSARLDIETLSPFYRMAGDAV